MKDWADRLEPWFQAAEEYGMQQNLPPEHGGAYKTGSLIAFQLRLGKDLRNREGSLKILKAGQKGDGAFASQQGLSDLEATYRVMRAFSLLKEKPNDVAKLRAYIAKCRNADGGYGVSLGEASSAGGTSYAAIITHWLDELEKKWPAGKSPCPRGRAVGKMALGTGGPPPAADRTDPPRENDMAGFRVTCPSCDNPVVVKDPALAGTKVECPKCKYRFKAEAPKDEEPAAKGGKGKPAKGKGADEGGKKKPAKGKSNRKVVIGAVLGVLAIALLAVGAVTILGGGDKEKPAPAKPAFRPQQPVASATSNTGTPEPKDAPPKPKDVPPPAAALARSDKDPTNLLPSDTRAVARFDLPKLRRGPLYPLVADPTILAVFRTSMGFDADLVAAYYHAAVGPGRAPFGLIRLTEPMAEAAVVSKMSVTVGPASPIQGRAYHTIKENAFLDAVGKLLGAEMLFGRGPAAAKKEPPPSKPLAVCVYDTQTVLIADRATLEAFLTALQPNGYPEFKSELTKTELPPPVKGPLRRTRRRPAARGRSRSDSSPRTRRSGPSSRNSRRCSTRSSRTTRP